MKNNTKCVMVFGTFDLWHPGHADFFKQAKRFGDKLTAVVARDETVLKLKNRPAHNNENIRAKNVRQSGLADQVLLGNKRNKYAVIKKIKPDVICLGYDQEYFVTELSTKIKEFDLKIKVTRLKAFMPDKYKSSILKSHKSVGVVVRNGDKILMLSRKHFPLGWAGPAGHIDSDETPEQALIRETKEETDLTIEKYRLIYHEYVDWNECGDGVMGHDWWLYEAEKWTGDVKLNENEHTEIGWKTISEIEKLKLEKIWEYWFKKLKII